MEKYAGNKAGDMSVKVKDYQPSSREFAGEMAGKANQYMERKEKQMNKDASRVKSQAHKGRYD